MKQISSRYWVQFHSLPELLDRASRGSSLVLQQRANARLDPFVLCIRVFEVSPDKMS